MYCQLKIEASTPEGIMEGLEEAQEAIRKNGIQQHGAMRPRYAFAYERKKSIKKTYYYVDWNNYSGSGCVRQVQLTRDEYLRLKGWGGNPETIKGLPNVFPYETQRQADYSLNQHYCD